MDTARHYGKGGAIRRMADGGLIGKIKSVFSSATTDRKPSEAPIGTGAAAQAKTAITTRRQTIDEAEKKAMGMKHGGAVRGKGTATSDDIPIMASNGEFMLKAAAVKKIGVPALEALNAIADGDKKPSAKKKPRGAVRKMAQGGYIDETGRRVAPYVNHRAPSGPPVMQEQLRLPNGAPRPGSAVATRPGPNFTMGGTPQQPPPAVDPVTDVRAKGPAPRLGYTPAAQPVPGSAVATTPYKPNFTMGGNPPPQQPPAATDVRAKFNPANASPEYKAFQAERAANPGPQPAGASPTPQSAQPQRPGSGAVRRAGAAVANAGRAVAGNRVVGAVGRLAAPVVAGTSIATTADTPTEDYETRFGFGPSGSDSPAVNLVRDIGVRALGAASDLGNTLTGGLAGQFYRDKQARAGQLTPADPVEQPAAAPRAAPSTATPAPAAAAAPAPNPAAPSGAVRRIGNSYSGQNVTGDITINGQAPRGGFVGGTGDGTFRYGGASGGNDAALFEARKAAILRGDTDAVRGSYAIQGESFGAQPDPVDMLINNGRPMTVRKAGAIADLRRQQQQASGAAADRKLAQDKFDLEKDGAKLDNQSKQRLSVLQEMILNEQATPAQRKSAVEAYRALTGKAETQNRYTVVPGGQAIDPNTNNVYTRPSMVIDNQTGQFVEQQGAAAPAAPAVGAVKSGYRFKGGDPANQNSWEKV